MATTSDPKGDKKSTGTHMATISDPEGDQKPTLDDARSYVLGVEGLFKEEEGKFTEFVKVMLAFKSKRITPDFVCERMKELLKDDPVLLLGFNNFLPRGHTLPVESKLNEHRVEFDEVVAFVSKLRDRFAHNPQIYISFLEVLNRYRRGEMSMDYVCLKVIEFFHGHYDLIDEFGNFLPGK